MYSVLFLTLKKLHKKKLITGKHESCWILVRMAKSFLAVKRLTKQMVGTESSFNSTQRKSVRINRLTGSFFTISSSRLATHTICGDERQNIKHKK